MSSICLDLKPPNAANIAVKSYPITSLHNFKTFDGRTSNTREHVVSFLDSMVAHTKDAYM